MTIQEMCSGDETVVPAALRGYRTWSLDPAGRLRAAALPYLWQMGEQHAECMVGSRSAAGLVPARVQGCDCFYCRRPKPHAAPDSGCQCGFYGWYSPDDTRLMDRPVFGAIEVTGRVLLGTHGFRAERARVLGLVLPTWPPTDLLRDYCKSRLVPTFDSRDELVAQLPPDDVSQLVAHTCEGDPACLEAEFNVALRAAIGNFGVAFSAAGQNMARVAAAFSVPTDDSPSGSSSSGDAAPMSASERALAARRTRNTGPRLRNPFSRRGRAS
jgi:hypothetical protein